jgi:ribosomal protein S18 acetylase RimI-like enzyme
VVPDRQGTGIGSDLLAAIEVAAPSDVRSFALFTGPKSARNVALYERAGYRRVPSNDGLIHVRKEGRPA